MFLRKNNNLHVQWQRLQYQITINDTIIARMEGRKKEGRKEGRKEWRKEGRKERWVDGWKKERKKDEWKKGKRKRSCNALLCSLHIVHRQSWIWNEHRNACCTEEYTTTCLHVRALPSCAPFTFHIIHRSFKRTRVWFGEIRQLQCNIPKWLHTFSICVVWWFMTMLILRRNTVEACIRVKHTKGLAFF